jgi:hypothetical protein
MCRKSWSVWRQQRPSVGCIPGFLSVANLGQKFFYQLNNKNWLLANKFGRIQFLLILTFQKDLPLYLEKTSSKLME